MAKQNCQQLFIDRIPLTDTLEDLMTQPAIIECSMAQNVVTAVYGGKMVNDYCAELEVKEKAPVLGTNHAEYDILSPFVCSCDPFSLTGNAALGSFGYISNVDNYFDFHPPMVLQLVSMLPAWGVMRRGYNDHRKVDRYIREM